MFFRSASGGSGRGGSKVRKLSSKLPMGFARIPLLSRYMSGLMSSCPCQSFGRQAKERKQKLSAIGLRIGLTESDQGSNAIYLLVSGEIRVREKNLSPLISIVPRSV